MASTAALVITSVSSGGFALAGAFVNNWMTGRRDERAHAAQAALTITDTEPHIWTVGAWPDLNIALQRQEIELAFAGVPEDLITTFHRVTLACWHDYQEVKDVDDDGEETRGILIDLLDARRALGRAAATYLLGKKTRESERSSAIDSANAVMAEWEAEHPDVKFD